MSDLVDATSQGGPAMPPAQPAEAEQPPEHRALARTLATAEDELALHRRRLQDIANWIHDPAYDETARIALARRLALPEPRTARPTCPGRSTPSA